MPALPDLTVTIPTEVFAVYILVGVLAWLPLEAAAWRGVGRPGGPFWRELVRRLPRGWWRAPIVWLLWPVALRRVMRSYIRRRRRGVR